MVAETFSTRNHEKKSIEHNCGITGVFRTRPDVDIVPILYATGVSLQGRGHEGFGIWATDGHQIDREKQSGLVAEIMTPDVINRFRRLDATHGINFTRYSTSGEIDAWQPFETNDGLALVHNGNLTNAKELLKLLPPELQKKAKSDSWIATRILEHLSDVDPQLSEEGRVSRMAQMVDGAANFIIAGKNAIYALRDYKGFRPLVIGKLPDGGGYVAVSETAALRPLGAKYVREVKPGEGVRIDENGPQTFFLDSRTDPEKLSRCIFELIYFASPDSLVFGIPVYKVRERIGAMMAETDYKRGFIPDAVGYVQESGLVYAEGYAREMIGEITENYAKYGISEVDKRAVVESLVHRLILVKNSHVGRVFTSPNGRIEKSMLKHRVNEAAITDRVHDGKINVVIADDSTVRGDASSVIAGLFKNLEWYDQHLDGDAISEIKVNVHWRNGSPPIMHQCYMGMDFANPDELIAHRNKGDVAAIAREVGVESFRYATHGQIVAAATGLLELIEKFDKTVYEESNFCGACFTGRYPVDISGVFSKKG